MAIACYPVLGAPALENYPLYEHDWLLVIGDIVQLTPESLKLLTSRKFGIVSCRTGLASSLSSCNDLESKFST